MARPKNTIPRPHHHKPTGKARVRHNGKDYYLGPWNSPEAEQAYRRFCAEILATGSAPTPAAVIPSLTFAELAERYLEHARKKYQTRHVAKLEGVVGLVLSLYGMTPASEFGPAKLRTIQAKLSANGLCPATVNQRVTMLRKLFKWSVGWELVPGHVAHALREVEGLKKPPAIARPAPEADVIASLPYMPAGIQAMVQVQRLTGMRPGEICGLTIAEIRFDSPATGIWTYSPVKHKNAHHGHTREILIGPAAQAILAPWIEARSPEEFIFQPADSLPWKPKRNRPRPIGEKYAPEAYAKAVHRACVAAGVEPWSPNQLRHAAGTMFENKFGPEAARIILGHRTLSTTRLYVQDDLANAAEVVRKAG